MEQPTHKVCPNCQQMAFLDSPQCVRCGHKYRTHFTQPPPGQTQTINLAGDTVAGKSAQFWWPSNAIKRKQRKKLYLGIVMFFWLSALVEAHLPRSPVISERTAVLVDVGESKIARTKEFGGEGIELPNQYRNNANIAGFSMEEYRTNSGGSLVLGLIMISWIVSKSSTGTTKQYDISASEPGSTP